MTDGTRRTLLLAVMLSPIFGCARQSAPPPRAEATMSRDTLWERRRQCAAAIDSVLKHTGWATPLASQRVIATSNHYNESQDRCYVRIDTTNNQGDASRGIPAIPYYIYDAFDAGTSISCGIGKVDASFCAIDLPGKDTVFDCAQCNTLSKDLMTK